MKKAISLLAICCMVAVFAHSQQSQIALLECDSTTYKSDTIKAVALVYVDSTTLKQEVVRGGYAVRRVCKLMYRGSNGAPNAPTDQYGLKDVVYYISPGRTIQEKWIIKFITKQ
jgi:hypothetical protein